MPSPAERFAAARARRAGGGARLAEFAAGYEFGLDEFQVQACTALEAGHGVLVAAPTGAGKTVVGEFAVYLALAEGRKCFYTTPIKALSNQKFADLVARHGPDRVGLLTGDNSVNGDADIVVMTTEVLRNMLYAQSGALAGLAYVVMDEVHYLSDRFRGAVWEEVIIHLPESVRVVSLSATVSNAEEFGDWLVTVRGQTTIVVEEHRPVPLWQHVLVGNRLVDLWVEDAPSRPGPGRPADGRAVNPELLRVARDDERLGRLGERRPARGGRRPPPRSRNTPARPDMVERLDREALLPAIVFVFSRAGCDAAVEQCVRSGLRLTGQAERAQIRDYVQIRCADLPDQDLGVLGYASWLDALSRGIAAHHAGLLPTFKEVVEELFQRGLVKVVFATETLSLGINMPARSVVLEKLTKWNGETHAEVTPGEYTQLTGRAGRRGIDVEGHAVVLWQPGLDPRAVAGLASTRTYPLRSSFRPSYNMAVNLVASVGRHTAREILESSFAQYQADRAVVGMARQVRRNEEALAGYQQAMTCHLGDFAQYAALRRDLSDREAELSRQGAHARRAAAAASLESLRTGDVIRVPAGRRSGLAVVLDPGLGDGERGAPRPVVLTAERQVARLSLVDFPTPVQPLERLRVPKAFNPRSPQSRRDLAATLRNAMPTEADVDGRHGRGRSAAADDRVVAELRQAIRAHPCHGCDDREAHARWAERHQRLAKETAQLEARVESRTNTIARTFDLVCSLLESLGYLSGDEVSPDGHRLARLYSELDLLAAECVRDGLWSGLGPAELAACVSALVFESRQSEDSVAPRLPDGRVREVLAAMVHTWGRLDRAERDHGLAFLREPDLGFAWAAHRWTAGGTLEAVLGESGLSAGDFVRWAKQLVDLLAQVGQAAGPTDPALRATANSAVAALRRGVVSYTSVG